MSERTTSDLPDLLSELRWRGLLHQATDEGALAEHFGKGRKPDVQRRVYCGFDPTADSLTIGNLVPIMLLKHVKEWGHIPIVLMGGATGRIGDPSGKSAERTLMSDEQVDANIAQQREIFTRVLGSDVAIVNNLDWWKDKSFLWVLREVGKHFSVNVMMQKDSVRDRLQNRDQGISFTEFSYQILQGYDFLHLAREEGVTVQCGGSDQWGNIVGGADLIRRAGDHAFAFTAPLVTKADGGKFGKSEAGAVWLSGPRTTAYAFHQFWLNAADADVERFLKMFTLLERAEIESLVEQHKAAPEKRVAQRALADAATAIVHGDDAVRRANAAASALFSGEVAGLDRDTLHEVFAAAPNSEHALAILDGEGWSVVDALAETGLASSKSQARQFVKDGAVTINGQAKASMDTRLTRDDLLHGEVILLRRGKKNWHVCRFGAKH
ncbi:MAG: tyrosine--tRNA ligase [Phycisphaerales bacterium]